MAFSILLTLLLTVVPALSTPLLAERNTCNRDNVLRALVDKRYIDEAIPFCSKYIHVPASTVTATTSCQTVTITAIVDPYPVTMYG
jgi:Cu/Ag efflux pump CusA